MVSRTRTKSRSTARRQGARNTRNGRNAMGIQRAINKDYVNLADDYGKLFVELWRKPSVPYILGGIALIGCIPLVRMLMDEYPEVSDFIRENVTDRVPFLHGETFMSTH